MDSYEFCLFDLNCLACVTSPLFLAFRQDSQMGAIHLSPHPSYNTRMSCWEYLFPLQPMFSPLKINLGKLLPSVISFSQVLIAWPKSHHIPRQEGTYYEDYDMLIFHVHLAYILIQDIMWLIKNLTCVQNLSSLWQLYSNHPKCSYLNCSCEKSHVPYQDYLKELKEPSIIYHSS